MKGAKTRVKKSEPHADDQTSKQKLIEIATRLFGERGFDRTTIQDIVAEAGLNVCLVSYYFGGKEGLHQTCLERATGLGSESAERILTKPQSQEEFKIRWRLFVEDILQTFCANLEVVQFLTRQAADPEPSRRALFRKYGLRLHTVLENFIAHALKKKYLRPELDLEITTTFLMSSVLDFTRPDCLAAVLFGKSPTSPSYRKTMIDFYSDDLLRGFLA